jgi:hypothetical protein
MKVFVLALFQVSKIEGIEITRIRFFKRQIIGGIDGFLMRIELGRFRYLKTCICNSSHSK